MTDNQDTTGRLIHVSTVEEAIPVIISYVTTAIADAGIRNHDLNAVWVQMSTDKVIDTLRAAYLHRTNVKGDTPKEAVISVGIRLIQAYRTKFGI